MIRKLTAERRAVLSAVPLNDAACRALVERERAIIAKVILTPGGPGRKAQLLVELIEAGDFEPMWKLMAMSIASDLEPDIIEADLIIEGVTESEVSQSNTRAARGCTAIPA